MSFALPRISMSLYEYLYERCCSHHLPKNYLTYLLPTFIISMYCYLFRQTWLINQILFQACVVIYLFFILVSVLTILFGSIVVGGYIVYGHTINPNILMSLGDSWLSYAAIVLMAGHLILGFVIMVKPVSEQVESFFNTPHSKHYNKWLLLNRYNIIYYTALKLLTSCYYNIHRGPPNFNPFCLLWFYKNN